MSTSDRSTSDREAATLGSRRALFGGRVPAPYTRDEIAFWLDILATVLLAAAALVTAWSSAQASRWGGVGQNALVAAGAARAASVEESDRANQLVMLDTSLFTQYVATQSEGNTYVADFLAQRFRPDFKKAFDAWLATKPFSAANAPKTPFEMQEYVVAPAIEASRLEQEAQRQARAVSTATTNSESYVQLTVILAIVLFLTGIQAKVKVLELQVTLVVVAILGLFIATIIVIKLPVA